MQFLGIKISEVTKEQALQRVSEFLNSAGQYKIFTPNPEFVVKAQKDEYFKKVLNAGDLNLCDGFGLELAIRLSFRPERSGVEKSLSSGLRDPSTAVGMTIERISGVDFMVEICRLAAEQAKRVYLLGSGSDEVVKKTAEELQKKFPNLKIAGYDKGLMIDEVCHSEQSEESLSTVKGSFTSVQDDTIAKINNANPDILFVAFGMGKQEKWIYENLTKMPNVKVAMGVGGSFDFISGKVKRAPLFLRQLGLEWMYRLIQEPRRFRRIFNATVNFCYLVIKSYIYEKKI